MATPTDHHSDHISIPYTSRCAVFASRAWCPSTPHARDELLEHLEHKADQLTKQKQEIAVLERRLAHYKSLIKQIPTDDPALQDEIEAYTALLGM